MFGPPEVDELFLRYQEPDEIFPALEFLNERKPRGYLELGSGAGVSLHCAMEAFGKDCRYRAIDILQRADHSKRLMDIVEEYNAHGYDVALLRGHTQKHESVSRARDDGPYDVVMVDADHNFRPVIMDITNYAPLLSPSGALVMHDIDPLGILDGITKHKQELANSRHVWLAAEALLPKAALRKFITPDSKPGSKKGIGIIEAWALEHV